MKTQTFTWKYESVGLNFCYYFLRKTSKFYILNFQGPGQKTWHHNNEIKSNFKENWTFLSKVIEFWQKKFPTVSLNRTRYFCEFKVYVVLTLMGLGLSKRVNNFLVSHLFLDILDIEMSLGLQWWRYLYIYISWSSQYRTGSKKATNNYFGSHLHK